MGFKPKDFGHIYHFNPHTKFKKRRTVRQRIARNRVFAALKKSWLLFFGSNPQNETKIDHTIFIEDLEELEFEGMMLKARAYLDRTHMLFLFAGTSFASVFTNWQLWLNLVVFWVCRLFPMIRCNSLPSLSLTALGMSNMLAQWTLVFYINQCYGRFINEYNFCMSSSETIVAAIKVARTCMSKSGQWRLFRHLNASHLLTYIGIGDEYSEEGLFVPANERHVLLSPAEVQRIRKIGLKGSAAYREVLAWAMLSVNQEYMDGHLTIQEMKILSSCVLALRGSLARLFHFADFPIPFSYRNLIHLLVHVFLTLFTFSMAYSYNQSQYSRTILNDSIIESACVLFITATGLSIVQLGKRIQDPFGHDREDLPVVHFVTSAIHASHSILCAPEIRELSEGREMNLFQKRPQLGKQFHFHYGHVRVRKQPLQTDIELEVFHLVCIKKVKIPNLQTIHVRKKKKKKKRNTFKIHPL